MLLFAGFENPAYFRIYTLHCVHCCSLPRKHAGRKFEPFMPYGSENEKYILSWISKLSGSLGCLDKTCTKFWWSKSKISNNEKSIIKFFFNIYMQPSVTWCTRPNGVIIYAEYRLFFVPPGLDSFVFKHDSLEIEISIYVFSNFSNCMYIQHLLFIHLYWI